MTVVDQAKTAFNIFTDWLGEGGHPVPQEIAESRASVCMTCPQNQHGKWWERAGKNAIAATMRAHIEAKNSIALHVRDEDQLNLCHVCGCALPTKVHVPLHHILAHTNAETLAAFPKNCWIVAEQAELDAAMTS